MCDKCKDIDGKVAHYTDLASRLYDPEILENIKRIVAELLAAKELLHPSQE